MTTVELERTERSNVDELERLWNGDPDDDFCHLYVIQQSGPPPAKAICGAPNPRKPDHWGAQVDDPWRPGQTRCSVCGNPLCPDCLYVATRYDGACPVEPDGSVKDRPQ